MLGARADVREVKKMWMAEYCFLAFGGSKSLITACIRALTATTELRTALNSLGGGREDVNGLEVGERLTGKVKVLHHLRTSAMNSRDGLTSLLTGDALLHNIEHATCGGDNASGLMVQDENLPAAARVRLHTLDGFEDPCAAAAVSEVASGGGSKGAHSCGSLRGT